MSKSKVSEVTFNREWRRTDGITIFYFDIKFEDGIIGQFSTNKREQTKFHINQEYEYLIKGQNKRQQNVIDLVKEDRPAFKSTYNDPGNNLRIALSVSLNAAIQTAVNLDMKNLTEEDIYAIAHNYYKWIVDCVNNRDTFSLRWNSLLNAVAYMPINDIKNSSGVIESAKEFYAIIEKMEMPS